MPASVAGQEVVGPVGARRPVASRSSSSTVLASSNRSTTGVAVGAEAERAAGGGQGAGRPDLPPDQLPTASSPLTTPSVLSWAPARHRVEVAPTATTGAELPRSGPGH